MKQFNLNNTFGTFSVCNSNELAFAVAKAIAQNIGKEYNPFFIYGKHGSGKTHLLHAIGNEILNKNRNFKILYLTGKELASDMVNENESDLYKKYDILMVDGIGIMAGKEDAQKLLLNIIDAFVASKKQVIITSELAPICFSVIDKHYSTYDNCIIADINAPKNIHHETGTRPLMFCKSCDMM